MNDVVTQSHDTYDRVVLGRRLPVLGVVSALFGFCIDAGIMLDEGGAHLLLLPMFCFDVLLGYSAGALLRKIINKPGTGRTGIFMKTLLIGAVTGLLIGLFGGFIVPSLSYNHKAASGIVGLLLGLFISYLPALYLACQYKHNPMNSNAFAQQKSGNRERAVLGKWLPALGVICALLWFWEYALQVVSEKSHFSVILTMFCGDLFLGYMAGFMLRKSINKPGAGRTGIFVKTLLMGMAAGFLVGLLNGTMLWPLFSSEVMGSCLTSLVFGGFIAFWTAHCLVLSWKPDSPGEEDEEIVSGLKTEGYESDK